MDGTLIDSEDFHWFSWRDTMSQEGVSLTHEQFLATFGWRNDSILRQWLGAAATPELIERVGSAKEKLYRELVRKNGMSPLPGVSNWIERLHARGWLQAIASSAPRLNVEVVLGALGMTHYFQGVVSAEDVHKGKPDPEVYLTAAARVGAVPGRCVVVEDAAAGIAGARHAGMRSIGVNRNGGLLAADVAVKSLDLLDDDAFDRLVAAA